MQVLSLCDVAQQARPQSHRPPLLSTVPAFALTLASATASLGGVRLAVRRVTDTKQYWTSASGREFVTCALPGDKGSRGACSLIIDPGFKENFTTANMSPRYR